MFCKMILRKTPYKYINELNKSVTLYPFKRKISRGCILEAEWYMPEAYTANRLKKSKFKRQIQLGKLRYVSYVGRCIALYNSVSNVNCNFILRNIIKKITVENRLFVHSGFVVSMSVRVKKFPTKSKLFYLRKKPKKYTIVKF